MIEVRALTKRFGERVAVDAVSFDVEDGEVFGLLGPNGAGKSTTLHMLVGALAPDGGSIHVDGQADPTRAELKAQVGIAPQDTALYGELSAAENLAFCGRLYGLSGARLAERVDWGLVFAGLTERRKDRVSGFSGGMKRRLNLACALVHEPRLVFCDEPTVGVDPQSRNHLLENIEQLRDDGCTLLYTTHYMEEAQRLCDRVAIMDKGLILALDRVDTLIAKHGGQTLVEAELISPPEGIELPGSLDGTSLRVETDRPLDVVADLGRRGLDLRQLRIDLPDLEQVFLHLTGRSLRD